MKNIHVCLVSDQPIPNLTTIRQFRPDKVILLYTTDMQRQKKRLEDVLSKWQQQVDAVEINPYDLGGIIEVCEQLIAQHVGDTISLNITGGTKISTIGCFQVFYSSNLQICYVNTRDDQILHLSPVERSELISARIQLADYLGVHGFNVTNWSRHNPALEKRSKAARALRDLTVQDEWKLGKINKAFPTDYERAAYPLLFTPEFSDLDILSGPLVEAEILSQSADGKWYIPSLDASRFLKGFWLEELVYLTAKQIGADDVRLNVEGRWDVPGSYSPANEFDVVIAKGTRLYLISCKTAYPNRSDGSNEGIGKEYLYELDALGDRALGLFGKKMIVSARSITNKYVRKRAQSMGITLLDKESLPWLKERLTEWLSS